MLFHVCLGEQLNGAMYFNRNGMTASTAFSRISCLYVIVQSYNDTSLLLFVIPTST